MSEQVLQDLVSLNRTNSALFCNTIQDRRTYRAQHPTEIIVTLCMDGRVNWYQLTGLPVGLCQLVRNIGGKYEIGWPLLQETLNEWSHYAHINYKPALLIITYHFSKNDFHRGCAGFAYDTPAALFHMQKFRDDIKRCYGNRIFPIVVGIETDADALLIHGENGEKFSTAEFLAEADEHDLLQELVKLFPSLPEEVLCDFAPIVQGNIIHTREICKTECPILELEHAENVLALGRWFDWITKPNFALVVGICDPDLRRAIAIAASIIQKNLQAGRISQEQGGVLITSWPYRDRRNRLLAIEQARYYKEFALRCIREKNGVDLSAVQEFFTPVAVVLNMDTRLMEIV